MKKIDLTVAKQMVDRYKTTRKVLINQQYGINDTESVWFDIASFKDYVANLPAETTGVRIYLGVYDDADPVAPSQTTVVFAGTVDKENSNADALSDSSVLGDGLQPFNDGKPCPPFCPN